MNSDYIRKGDHFTSIKNVMCFVPSIKAFIIVKLHIAVGMLFISG